VFSLPPRGKGRGKPNNYPLPDPCDGSLLTSVFFSCRTLYFLLAKHKEHTNSNGTPQIVSIHVKWNAYIVEWENKENQEWGTDKVTKDGEVKMIEASIE
jgi:hypothetical protein